MKASTRKNRLAISQMLTTFISFSLFLYFGFHLVHGEMGYFALRGLEQKEVEMAARQGELQGKRVALENRVALLRPNSLDLDMLDERARAVLGFTNPQELVVLDH